MTKTAHTPGPWECDTAGQPIIVNGPEDKDGRNVICTVEDADCMHGQYQYSSEVAAANAQLIAAAPDLLKACRDAEGKLKQLCDMVNTYSNQLGLGDKVRIEHWLDHTSAAIAKAKGKTTEGKAA